MGIMTNRPIGTEAIQTLPLVFIDIETTGYSRVTAGEICEIGVVKVDPVTRQTVGELNLKLQVQNPLNKTEAELSFNGYSGFTFAEWQDAVPVQAAIMKLNDFCTGCVAWGWNISFEFYWLSAYFEELKLNWKGDYHWLCLMSISSFVLREEFTSGKISKLSLSQVSAFLGLGEEPNPHRGLTGAQYEADIYRKIIERTAKS